MTRLREQEQYLSETYSQYSDDELLRMHRSGTLTELAYGIVEKELAERKISIPARPTEPCMPELPPPLLDRTPLWLRVIMFLFGSILTTGIYPALVPPPHSGLEAVLFQGLPTFILLKILLLRGKGKVAPKSDG